MTKKTQKIKTVEKKLNDDWLSYGEYWNKEQIKKGKLKAKKAGYAQFKTTKGSFIGSFTLWVKDQDYRYLTTQEANQSIKEGCIKEDLTDQFKIPKRTLEKLLSGKIKKFKIPKTSMWYESDQ